MKINPMTVSKIYSSNIPASGSSVQKPSGDEKCAPAKVDTISISAEGIRKNDISKLAKQIAVQVENDTKPERLEELKRKIANNEYNISTEDIADAILGHIKTK